MSFSTSRVIRNQSNSNKNARLQVERLEERMVMDVALATLVMTPSTRLVSGLYYDLLGRQPTEDEVSGWSTRLDQGLPRGNLAEGFLQSAEFRSNQIRDGYREILNREPEAGAISAWQQRMASGLSTQQYLSQLVASDEYYAMQQSRANQYIASLYSELFGRQADAAGLNYWTQQLSKRNADRGKIANIFVNSDEGLGNLLTQTYQDILGRNPDPTGYRAWLDALHRGQINIDQLRQRMVTSSEYNDQQQGVDLPVLASDSNSNPRPGTSPGNALSVGLLAPEFSADARPVMQVVVSQANYSGRARIDVDLNHNGTFDDSGEAFFTSGTITPQNRSITLNALPAAGTYSARAIVRDSNGRDIISQVVSFTGDAHSGELGSSALTRLYDDFMEAKGSNTAPGFSFFLAQKRVYSFDAQNRVKVNVQATLARHMAALQTELQQRGMVVTGTYAAQNLLVGYLPIEQLNSLASLGNFHSATPVYAPILRAGSVNTQGDRVMKADAFRQVQLVDGTGIKIGVLSDTVNRVDSNNDRVVGVAESQKTSDLPAAGVEILRDGPIDGTDEGRAMLEIVHDVAPGAKLAFYSATDGPQEFAKGIQALANAGASVIVDDVGYLNSPFFNDGVISQAVDKVASQGVFYATAAGNDGLQGFQANWRGITATVAGQTGTFFDLGGGDVLQQFSLNTQKGFTLSFQWDSAFLEGGSTLNNYRVRNEVDVLIVSADGSRVLAELNDNTLNTNEALQIGNFFNDGSFGTNNFAFAFKLAQGSAPNVIRWLAAGDDPKAEKQGAPTIYGQPTANGAIAVGAVAWSDLRKPESFSSLGGSLPIYFDAKGNRLTTTEIRQKPEVSAPDGVSTSFFGVPALSTDSDRNRKFFGTSAAAPHVAAVAALLKQQFPSATLATLVNHLEKTALGVPTTGLATGATIPGGFAPNTGGGGSISTRPVSVGDIVGSGIVQVIPITTSTGPTDGTSGNAFEPNDSSDRAAIMGVLANGSRRLDGLSIINRDGILDSDWFRYKSEKDAKLSVGLSYQSTNGGDLHLRVYRLNNENQLIQLGSSRQGGTTGQRVEVNIKAGESIMIWVYGYNRGEGSYNLETVVA